MNRNAITLYTLVFPASAFSLSLRFASIIAIDKFAIFLSLFFAFRGRVEEFRGLSLCVLLGSFSDTFSFFGFLVDVI